MPPGHARLGDAVQLSVGQALLRASDQPRRGGGAASPEQEQHCESECA